MLRWVRVQIATSLSGAAYRSDITTIASPPASSVSFATRTDRIVDYKTSEALSVPLRYKNQRVGVAQFLNKRTSKFESADADRAQALCATLAVRVGDFVSDTRNLIELAHAPRRNQHKVTIMIMIMDLSNYARLFEALDVSVITDMLNQYFQELCTIAMRHSAMIDQFMDDGALLIFNLDQTLDSHESAALDAATEMRKAFGDLAEIGHPQSRRVTVLGPTVNIAAHICDHAPRDHDTICVTGDMREGLASTDARFIALSDSLPRAFEIA
jgi:class 3 adenylate cyclase